MRVGTTINSSIVQTDNGTIEKYCYDDIPARCTAFHPSQPDGGLYTWDEAMQYSDTEGAQGICPNGWHIPTEAEWTELVNYLDPTVGGALVLNQNSGTDIGTKLQPGGSSGFGFNLAGVKTPFSFSGRDGLGEIWFSTERDSTSAFLFTVLNGIGTINKGATLKDSHQMSVRCILD